MRKTYSRDFKIKAVELSKLWQDYEWIEIQLAKTSTLL